jgi:hypothetical protein
MKKDLSNINNFRCWYLIRHVFTPIFIGSLLYIFWRQPDLLVFSWIEYLHLDEFIFSIRETVSPVKKFLPEWVIVALPNGLWVYAMTICMGEIWLWEKSDFKYLWLCVGLYLGISSEVGQAFGFVPGFFDPVDLFFYSSGFVIAILLINRRVPHV